MHAKTALPAWWVTTPALATEHIYNVITASGEWTSNINDTQHFTTATNTVAFTATAGYGRSRTTAYLDGVSAELIIFDAKLSSGDRDSVFADLEAYYLAAAAGLSIPVAMHHYRRQHQAGI